MTQPTTSPLQARVALFALRSTVGPDAVASAFAWAARPGAPPDALAVARERLVAGARVGADGHWSHPAGPGAPAPPSPLPSGPPPGPGGGAAEPGRHVGASLPPERPVSRPPPPEPTKAPIRVSNRHPPLDPSGAPSPAAQGVRGDHYVHITTSIPASLRDAITARSAALGLDRAAYLRGLVRADLGAAGWPVPPDPPPAPRGRHARPGGARGQRVKEKS